MSGSSVPEEVKAARLTAGVFPTLGVLESPAMSKLVGSFLFDVSATDPLIYLGAVVMMILAILVSTLPAARAASVDPMQQLRQ